MSTQHMFFEKLILLFTASSVLVNLFKDFVETDGTVNNEIDFRKNIYCALI